jgi:uncharacterized protein (TIGR02145 family)
MKLLISIFTGLFAVMVCTAQKNDTVSDADGNVYNTLKIGNQVWTVENLRTTKYNDNTPIGLDTSAVTWAKAIDGKYCYCNNTTNKQYFGKF